MKDPIFVNYTFDEATSEDQTPVHLKGKSKKGKLNQQLKTMIKNKKKLKIFKKI